MLANNLQVLNNWAQVYTASMAFSPYTMRTKEYFG